MTMKSSALAFLAISSLTSGMNTRNSWGPDKVNPGNVTGKLPPKVKPKGTSEYFFNKDGNFAKDRMLKSECVFKCFALNDKSAKRKFETFIKKSKWKR